MIIDLTHKITPAIPMYPGDEPPAFFAAATLARNQYRATRFTLDSHTGTHMDAPAHLLADGAGLDELPVSQFCGRAVVLDVSRFGPGAVIEAEDLEPYREVLRTADFALFYTGCEKLWGTPEYLSGYPTLSEEAARQLLCYGLKGVGVDACSVDRQNTDTLQVHQVFLQNGMIILENLCLRKIAGRTDVMLFALPLKFENADGSPIRAVAEFRDFDDEEMKRA